MEKMVHVNVYVSMVGWMNTSNGDCCQQESKFHSNGRAAHCPIIEDGYKVDFLLVYFYLLSFSLSLVPHDDQPRVSFINILIWYNTSIAYNFRLSELINYSDKVLALKSCAIDIYPSRGIHLHRLLWFSTSRFNFDFVVVATAEAICSSDSHRQQKIWK